MLAFTGDQFLALFAAYNEAVWPAQILSYLLGVATVVLVIRPSRAGGRIIGLALAVMWVWTGVAYHWLFFSSINKAALPFGALFIVQGGLLFFEAVWRGRMTFGMGRGPTAWLGWTFVIYAAAIYPLLGMWMGHRYPEIPMFGISPCPVTIFTFGLLLLTTTPVSRWLFVIPVLWSLVGGSAAILLGVTQDWFLLFSGAAVPLILLRDRNLPPAPSAARRSA
ncbi:hypothetical protein VAPA_2c06060 [Variovorax paradoxus B4]|uniref:MFS transporter permease n=2 Tax=Variovorax paradoxus TaxID=34073 RepID=A0A0H2LUX2_VARPD|nr:DUF6064 family protein [Variovorax paradoxus]AGU53165.1 hypothetical protein VAPA_2c06060 [Variovorax paradoxus B4]KLN53486.1 hypothetical protein VPARA_53250 [Variovorax paradoxus]